MNIGSAPIEEINSILTENERTKAIQLHNRKTTNFDGKDYSQLRVTPNSPLAAQVIEDKVIEMLLFVTLRYQKGFQNWK